MKGSTVKRNRDSSSDGNINLPKRSRKIDP